MEEEFKVVIPIPKPTTYILKAAYPEEAKRSAAKKHQHLLPRMTVTDIALTAHCYRTHPKTAGGRPKEPSFIEELYRKVYGDK